MLSDKTIIKLTKAVSAQFGEEIGQQVALRLIVGRNNGKVRDWKRLSFWFAWDARNMETKHQAKLVPLEDYVESMSEGTSTDRLDETVDARLTLKAVRGTVKGRRLINHVLGKSTVSREWFRCLRRIVREEVGYEG